MTTSQNQPDATYNFTDGKADLYTGRSLNYNGEAVTADRMVLEHTKGNEEDVLIFERDGKRRVGRVIPEMSIPPGSPAVTLSPTFPYRVGDIPADDEKRLLAIYDYLPGRTFQH
jgi:hypothetical protein